MLESIHQIISESVGGGFWRFIGYYLMTSLIFCGPLLMLKGIIKRATRKDKPK